MKPLIFLIPLICLGSFLGCGGGEEKAPKYQAGGSEYEQAANQIRETQESIRRGKLLTSATPADKNGIEENLERAYVAVMRLARNAFDVEAVEMLGSCIKHFEIYQVSNYDSPILKGLVESLGQIWLHSVNANSLAVEDVAWDIYSYDFSEGLSPFMSSGDKPWSIDFSNSQARFYAKSSNGGRSTDSWLVSPTFDFSRIGRPAFSYNHTIIINQASRYPNDPFSRPDILGQAFRVFATEVPFHQAEDEDWKEVPKGALPSSYDFHSVDSGTVDLSEFAGKTSVTLAFVFSYDSKKLGRHYVTWQVNHFNLTGVSAALQLKPQTASSPSPEPEDLRFEHDFSEGTKSFTKAREENAARWRKKTWNDSAYVSISGYAKKNDGMSRLISPEISLSGMAKPAIQLRHALNHYTAAAREKSLIQVLVGELKSGELTNLQELKFKKFPSGRNWDVVESEWLEFPAAYHGKSVVVVFHYKSIKEEKLFPNWNLYKMRVGEK